MKSLLLFLLIALVGCNPKVSGKIDSRPKIGVDPTWTPQEFGVQNPYVNGFVEEFLLEIATALDTEFNKLRANPNDLLTGLDEGIYDAVLTSLPPFTFNLAKYDFSKTFLETGPVFIVPKNAPYKKLSQVKHQYVGVIAGSKTAEFLAQYPTILVRKYLSAPDLLNEIVRGEIAGGLLPRVSAAAYVPDLYQDTIQIASQPLNNQGLHLVTLKNANEELLQEFDEALLQLKRKKKLESLYQKWSLSLQ